MSNASSKNSPPPSAERPVTDYPRPAVAVDVVLFTIREAGLEVLLIERGAPPFEGMWALPGGFVREHENLEQAAARELAEETNVRDVYLEQLYTFGEPQRDPRMRVISVVYFALVAADRFEVQGGTDASDAAWHDAFSPPPLAFDHPRILGVALERLRYKLEYAPVAFQLLPEHFTLTELQTVYETILQRELDKRNFRRKILSLGFLRKTPHKKREGAHRPAQLYAFIPEKFHDATGGGVIFSF